MTKEYFETKVKQPALDKWAQGAKKSRYRIFEWWCEKGDKPCGFCKTFKDCSVCPVADEGANEANCRSEFSELGKLMNDASAFDLRLPTIMLKRPHRRAVKLCKGMRKAISKVKYDPAWANI